MIFLKYLVKVMPNSNCNYTFPIDLTPKGFSFGAKSKRTFYILIYIYT